MKKLYENWRRFIVSESVELTNKEKAEAETLLKMTGYELKQRVEMVLSMGAQPVYEKILGAMQSGVYGEKGNERAAEIMQIAPNLKPVEGEFTQDSEEAVVFEEGPYVTQEEWERIQRYIEVYRQEKNKLQAAEAIQRDADAQRDYHGWVMQISDLFRRLKDYGSYLDDSRGALLQRGGWKRAVDAGYVIRPEDDQKIPVSKDDWNNIAGTRIVGYDLLDAVSQYVEKRAPWDRR